MSDTNFDISTFDSLFLLDQVKALRAYIWKRPEIAKTRLHAGRYSTTPLHIAAQQGAFNCVEELLRAGAEVNATDTYGNTPLDVAAFHRRHMVAGLLEYHGGEKRRSWWRRLRNLFR